MARPTAPWLRVEWYVAPINGKLMSNVFWFAPMSLSGGIDLAAVASAAFTYLNTALASLIGSDATIYGCTATLANGTARTSVDYYSPTTGGGSGTSLPEFWCAIVQRHSSAPGRHGNGRIFVAPLDESLVDGNYLNSTGLALLTTAGTDLTGNLSAAAHTWVPQLYSSSLNQLNNIGYWAPVALLATARRRKPRF